MLRRTGLTSVVYHSHRFNLYVEDTNVQHGHEVSKIRTLMKRLSYYIPVAELRIPTSHVVEQRNEIRWNSTYSVFSRFDILQSLLVNIDDEDVCNTLYTIVLL